MQLNSTRGCQLVWSSTRKLAGWSTLFVLCGYMRREWTAKEFLINPANCVVERWGWSSKICGIIASIIFRFFIYFLFFIYLRFAHFTPSLPLTALFKEPLCRLSKNRILMYYTKTSLVKYVLFTQQSCLVKPVCTLMTHCKTLRHCITISINFCAGRHCPVHTKCQQMKSA